MEYEINKIKKYLRIYIIFIKNSFMILFAHRFNLFMSMIANLVWTVAQFLSLRFLFIEIPSFQGWGLSELILLLAFGQIYIYTFYIFIEVNLSKFPKKLKRGDFDLYLLKPINAIFHITFEQISVAQVFALLLTVTPMLLYSFFTSHILIFNYLFGILVIFIGILIMLFLRLIIAALNFFMEDTTSFKFVLFEGTQDIARIPMNFLPRLVQMLFIFFIPLSFIAYYPVLIVKGDLNITKILPIELLILLVFFILQKYFWRKGLRHYSSASS